MTDRPNVLVVLQDELRYDLVADTARCRTPTFDALRGESTWFERAYTPTGLCSPARASLLTGLYAHGHRVLNNVSGPDAISRNLSRAVPTVTELLSDAGYRTGYVGKWHVGVEDQPEARGFADVRLTDGHPEWKGYAPISEDWRALNADVVMSRYREAHPDVAGRFGRRPMPMYAPDAIPEEMLPDRGVVDESIAVLRSQAAGDRPFFLVVSFRGPHWPHLVCEPYASMYDAASIPPWPNFADDFTGKPRTNQAGLIHHGVADFTWEDWQPLVARYLGQVSMLDAFVGRLLDALDATGRAEDTVVFVSADHGDMAGSHRQFNKGALMYEEVYRIPFVWRGPGVRAGESTDALASHIDVLPTLLDLADVASPETVHGRSLRPVLGGDRHGWRDALMCEYHGEEYGLYSQRMLRSGDHKLVYNPNDVSELYDLATDPHELHNLAERPEHQALRRRLEASLLEQMFESADSLRMWAVNTLG